MDNTVQSVHAMPRRKNNGSKIISVYMSPDLHQSIKLAATFDGMTMQDWVVSSLIETLKERPEITLPIANHSDGSNSPQYEQSEDEEEVNGQHHPQHAKVTKPPKYHKTYKGQAGEDEDLDIWDEDGDLDIGDEDEDLDILDEDINGDLQLSNQSNSQTNSYDFPKIKVTKPRKEHKRFKNKVGELLVGIDKDRAKVLLDGDIEILHSDEIEFLG